MLLLIIALALAGQPDDIAPAPIPHPWETAVRVRLRLTNGREQSGSGTVIASSLSESIVLTCGHSLRDPGSPDIGQITVDLFDRTGVADSTPGELLDADIGNEVGLIKIHPGRVLPASPVVPLAWAILDRMSMRTVGCSNGDKPTMWPTQILKATEWIESPITSRPFMASVADHRPPAGRSGGGLFTDDGYLAGVCAFASTIQDVGLYARPESIRAILDRNNLGRVYERRAKPVSPTGDKPSIEPELVLPDPKPEQFASEATVLQGVDRSKLSPTPRHEAKGEEGRRFQEQVSAGEDAPPDLDDAGRPFLLVIGSAEQRKPIMDAIKGTGKLADVAKSFRVQSYDPSDKYVKSYKATAERTPMVVALPGGSRVPAMVLTHYQRDPQDLVAEIAAKRSVLRIENPAFDPDKAAAGSPDFGAWIGRNLHWIALVIASVIVLRVGRRS